MIKYNAGMYGLEVLTRLHGSAAYKAITPAVISTVVFVVFYSVIDVNFHELTEQSYPFSALVVAFTFLLTFKANFSYQRYWEACTAVHQMHSKWLDVGMDLAAFHLQSNLYKQKPPAFGQHTDIEHLDRHRERVYESPDKETLEAKLDQVLENHSLHSRLERMRTRRNLAAAKGRHERHAKSIAGSYAKHRLPTPINPVDPKTEKPSFFLQEAAHLLSLLSAVAMSTLRNDIEGAESPLATFRRGDPWPAVDPDARDAGIREDWKLQNRYVPRVLRYILGQTRTPRDRTMYNAARPFRVIGGVSDAEVELLQAARGPFAKVALVSQWLSEFISREHLEGSTGSIGPPIIGRLFQFTSDGMLGYNQARKIAYVPFPFPHSQITTLFVLVVIVYIPVLMLSYVTNVFFGATLNFFTVMCFGGLHEVARELENPFQNVPNDLPLNNFQAQFNEALMNMFMGYHPDAYWLEESEDKSKTKHSSWW